MKKAFLILSILFTTTLFSQEVWGDVEKNKVTLKEIPPIWPGCENASNTSDCFTKKLSQHVAKNFRYPASAYKANVQGKVIVEFTVNEQGLPEIQKVSGGTAALQEEAKRNIMAIPKMKPGMLGGKPRSIKYTIPFNFKTGK